MGTESAQEATTETITHTWFLFILGRHAQLELTEIEQLLATYNIHTSQSALQQVTKFGYKICLFAWGTDEDVRQSLASVVGVVTERQSLCILGAFRATDDGRGYCLGECTPEGRSWAWKTPNQQEHT